MPAKRYLVFEFVLTFIVLPLVLSTIKPHGRIYILLWIFSALCIIVLERYHSYHFSEDWNFRAVNKKTIRTILLRFLPCAAVMLICALILMPDRLFSLPLQRPYVWIMVMFLYPPLSVFPQEIIYRSFFFARYRDTIHPKYINLYSALTFGWTHIVLHNWVAVVFSAVGGLLFADTYGKTRSLAAVCFEHALYGCYIFTIGMGYYFYHGIAVK